MMGESGPSPPPSPTAAPIAVSQDLAPLPKLKEAGKTCIDFDGQLLKGPLRYHEDVRAGCGGQTWPAGVVLGKHVLRYHRDELRDARMLVYAPPCCVLQVVSSATPSPSPPNRNAAPACLASGPVSGPGRPQERCKKQRSRSGLCTRTAVTDQHRRPIPWLMFPVYAPC